MSSGYDQKLTPRRSVCPYTQTLLILFTEWILEPSRLRRKPLIAAKCRYHSCKHGEVSGVIPRPKLLYHRAAGKYVRAAGKYDRAAGERLLTSMGESGYSVRAQSRR